MTDEQIIKALECCKTDNVKECDDCPYNEKETKTYCVNDLIKDALDLINRQKAEIEDLREIVFTDRSEAIKKLKSEAIKEFAERLKVRLDRKFTVYGREYVLRHLRELVKEMVGEQ